MAKRFNSIAKLLLALSASAMLQAQSQSPGPSTQLTFEVASIKPSLSSADGMDVRTSPGGGFVAHGITVRTLILNAYDLHDFQLNGGPEWPNSAKFDIAAKAENDGRTNVSEDRKAHRQRLQSLLTDRFHLKFHSSKKDLSIYALVVMKAGPKLQSATNTGNGASMTMRRGQLVADSLSMELLAANLSNLVDRIVQDRTGLTGSYALKLEWAPDPGPAPSPPGSENNVAAAEATGPSIFTALQEQLGLRLEPQKGEVETFVIDHVERPTEN